MSEKRLVSNFLPAGGANTFASENFNTVLYTGNGGTQRIGGYINRGAVFNGSSSKITLPSGSPFNDSDTIKAVSMWFRLPTTSSTLYGFSVGSDNSGSYFFNLYISGNTIGGQARNGGSSNQSTMAATWTADTDWHHVVWQLGSTEKEIYLDGTKLSVTFTNTGSASDTSWISYPSYSGNVVGQIGVNRATASFSYSDGLKDQVRIFNKGLSTSEITTLYGETHASTTISTTDIFDDNSGVALYQLDGNANDTGGVSGKFGSAAIFNGSTSEITANNPIVSETAFSLSAWINVNSTSTSNHILSVFNTATSSRKFIFRVQSGGAIRLLTYDSSGTTAANATSSSGAITAGTWHHVVAVENSGTTTVYVDGTSVATDSGSNNTNTSPTANLNFGGRDDFASSSNERMDGKIDDVRIYSDALTSAEVGYIYNNTTASIPTDNLEAYYKFDGDARDEQQLYDGVASNVTYAYDGTATNVTYQEATKFSPDLVWIKNRDQADNHILSDAVRGINLPLVPNGTNAEGAGTGYVTSYDSTGFTLGSQGSVNTNNEDYAAWCFNAGTDAAASNTDGVTSGSVTAVTSTVKANQDAGFSICEFTTPSSGKPSWGHGLSQAPELIIVKNAANTGHWMAWLPSILGQKELRFTNAAATSYSPDFISVDSSKIDLGSGSFNIGASSRHINYNFHSVDGFQKVGSYTGTGADNAVVTGFQPSFVMIKRTDSTGNWWVFDNERGNNKGIRANLSNAEDTTDADANTYEYRINFLSNGFEYEIDDSTSASPDLNASSGTFIYLAIAADPDETTPTVENSFDVVTYTGTGNTQSIATDFKPDFVWIKGRSDAEGARLFDTIRGANNAIFSNSTGGEAAVTGELTSLDSNGFTLGSNENVNQSSQTYVAWCWKAGDHDDSLPQINTEGTIDSVVSVNDAAGFSIVKFNGGNTSGTTVGHGLSSAPELIIVKNTSDIASWPVLTQTGYTIGATTFTLSASSNYLALNSTTGYISYTFDQQLGGTNNGGLASDVLIAYCFTSITGYQKVGSYTGTGSTVTVTTGFAPRFVMIKRTDSSGDWVIYDTQRGGTKLLFPYLNNAEGTYTSTYNLTFNSNGFSISSGYAASGGTYIYLAIK
jgi:hypothetical protein